MPAGCHRPSRKTLEKRPERWHANLDEPSAAEGLVDIAGLPALALLPGDLLLHRLIDR
jgi:hypothetical protein